MFFKRKYAASGIIGLALVFMMTGCEGERDDPTGVDAYFKTNAYSSAERLDPLQTDLVIEPASAKIDIIGQEIVFTASGGDGNYHWSLSNDNGELNSQGANQCIYKCKKIGNNDVIVQDESGHYAAAHITPVVDKMTITPSSASLSGTSRYVSFAVSGGTPPYSWSSGSASMGTVSYSASSTYSASYTAVTGAYGENTVIVRDSEGRIATATITQSE